MTTDDGFVALTNFISVTTASGGRPYVSGQITKFTPYNHFQNGKHGSVTAINGTTHYYLSFIYQGAARNRTGDNMTSSLILANSDISMNYAVEAVAQRYHINVQTWIMTDTFAQKTKLTEETWLASSMSYDPESIEVILSSAIDAVGANAPDKVLTKDIVGSLPVTGSLQNR